MWLYLFESLLVVYRVWKEKAVINQRTIVCPLENTPLHVFLALENSLFVGLFQMEYD